MPPRLVMPAWARAAWYHFWAVASLIGCEASRAGEQPQPRVGAVPPAAQQLQHVLGQRNVAVLAALALDDADAHAVGVAVDVGHAQMPQLRQSQARAVGQHQEGSRRRARGDGEQPGDLLAREDLGQALWCDAQWDVEHLAVQSEHGAVEEPERAAVLVDGGARALAIAQQVQQELLHLLGAQGVGAAPVVPGQARHGVDVGLLGAKCHAAQHQCVEHALSKWAHHRSPRSARAHARVDQGTAFNAATSFALQPPRQRFSSTLSGPAALSGLSWSISGRSEQFLHLVLPLKRVACGPLLTRPYAEMACPFFCGCPLPILLDPIGRLPSST